MRGAEVKALKLKILDFENCITNGAILICNDIFAVQAPYFKVGQANSAIPILIIILSSLKVGAQ